MAALPFPNRNTFLLLSVFGLWATCDPPYTRKSTFFCVSALLLYCSNEADASHKQIKETDLWILGILHVSVIKESWLNLTSAYIRATQSALYN